MDENTINGIIADLRAAHEAGMNVLLERSAQLRQMVSKLQAELEELKSKEEKPTDEDSV